MKAEMTQPGQTPNLVLGHSFEDTEEMSMLRSEVEMLVQEDEQLMKIAGAAALFVAELQGASLPKGALDAASTLAKLINEISDTTMRDALGMLHH